MKGGGIKAAKKQETRRSSGSRRSSRTRRSRGSRRSRGGRRRREEEWEDYKRILENQNTFMPINVLTDDELEDLLNNIKNMVRNINVPQETIAHWVNNAKNRPYPVTRESQKNIWRNFLINFSQLYE